MIVDFCCKMRKSSWENTAFLIYSWADLRIVYSKNTILSVVSFHHSVTITTKVVRLHFSIILAGFTIDLENQM